MTATPQDAPRGWELGEMLAYEGKQDCLDIRCRRIIYPDPPHIRPGCMGWHCPRCDEPCSSMGHKCKDEPPEPEPRP